MSNAPYQQMAKDFMDLWQKHISSVMSDKQFIHAMLEMFESMQSANKNETKRSNPANPAAPSDAQHGMLAELAFRVGMCERRLAALEDQSKPAVGKRHPRGSKKPRQ